MQKYIKRIFFFLSILLVQFSFGSNLACSSSFDDFNIGIEFSENPNLDFSELGFRENNIFEQSFLEAVSYRSISFCGGYVELVESWKALGDFPTLRSKIPNLETLEKVKGKFPQLCLEHKAMAWSRLPEQGKSSRAGMLSILHTSQSLLQATAARRNSLTGYFDGS